MTLPICTRSDWENIGYGVRIRRAYLDGALVGIDYQHPSNNPACNNGARGDYIPCAFDGSVAEVHWQLHSENPLTLSPSLQCPICKHHGFIRHGKWIPA